MSRWEATTLADLCSDISYGYTTSAKQTAVGPKFLRITDITPDRINWADVPYCVADKKDVHKYKLKNGDIVIARTGATTGYNKLIKDISFDAVYASYLIRYEIDATKAVPDFVGHILQSSAWYDYVDAIAGGSAQPGANAKQLGSFEFSLPPFAEQKAIAAVLSSLDAKIDLLHRQNKTLEAMAEALFRQWFVEDAQEGWHERPLSSIANFLNGLACQKYPPTDDVEKLPVLKIRELSNGISDTADWATSHVKPGYIVEAGDVIFAWSASLMVKVWDGEKCVLNQHLFKVTSDEFPKWFYLRWCKHHLAEFIAVAASHATTMGHIKRGDLDAAMVLVPPPPVLATMSKQMQPLLDKQIASARQRKTLEKLRDTLLPKLMSGEVRVAY
ncbi:MAG: restriction endonuclease subunit S [Polaromonas sp.]|uniref:restriction endonuclease subunit S n=1 Tax=Polaromonas sp. TaxID=1869339 RepID=UPI0027316DC1|nr:restriction endonuclease subunit S [Polaromonas sp.]MDP2255726.1 restriction endonuclease subunit S [Polaromonas sp.]MDP3708489.1 restriction endonuclease subunit S [Polaromonas sp.]